MLPLSSIILSDLVPYRYDIYIGSDNKTRKADGRYRRKIVDWANSVFPNGYTLTQSEGYYNGHNEDSILLSVLSSRELDVGAVLNLKRKLRQDAVLVARSEVHLETI